MNRHEFYDKLKEYNSLQHYGTKGQKWGVRNWQNPDGTFNEAGKERYFGKARHEGRKLLNEAKQVLKDDIDYYKNVKIYHDDDEKNKIESFKYVALDFMGTDYAQKFVKPIFDEHFKEIKEINSKTFNMPKNEDEHKVAAVLNALVDKNEDDIYDMYLNYNHSYYNKDQYINNDVVRILRNNNTLFDEYKISKDKLDNELNKVTEEFTKEMSDEEKQKFIDTINNQLNTKFVNKYRSELPDLEYDRSSSIYNRGMPLNLNKLDKVEDMKDNLNKAEEICTKMKDIQSQIYPKNLKKSYLYELEMSVLDTIKKLNLTNKKFDEVTEKDWKNLIKEGKKKFSENKKESDIKSHIFNKKYDIYLKLENTFGEMVYHFNNWDYTKEAKKNLGYDKIEDRDLTDAQWKNIKKEIIENTGKAKYQEYLEDMKKIYG